MSDIEESIKDAVEKAHESGFNGIIAVMVAVTATAMALGNVKDGNVCQAMQQAQASSIDAWSYYQAKSTRQSLSETAAEELGVQRDTWPGMTPEARTEIDKRIAELHAKAAAYEADKAKIQGEAKGYQAEYDRLGIHDDQFDMAEAAFSIAIALFGISALTQKRWLLGMAAGLAAIGMSFEVAGFVGWNLHPDFLAKFLS